MALFGCSEAETDWRSFPVPDAALADRTSQGQSDALSVPEANVADSAPDTQSDVTLDARPIHDVVSPEVGDGQLAAEVDAQPDGSEAGSDPCAAIVCQPDAPTCVDSRTLRTASYAECIRPEGVCHSTTGDITCVDGCENGACRAAGRWAAISMQGAPSPRIFQVTVWTGTEMMVWGGADTKLLGLGDGGRYNPASDTWTAVTTIGAPPPGTYTGVWTGAEVIVWGGPSGQDGGRYNPATDTWAAISKKGVPSVREGHSAVWTGTHMIVWGGAVAQLQQYLADGKRYDPVTDKWSPVGAVGAPSARNKHSAVWTGREMLILGGCNDTGCQSGSGGRYDPASDTWRAMSDINAPRDSNGASATWLGSQWLIWGAGDGFVYAPATDKWSWVFNYAERSRKRHSALSDGAWNPSATEQHAGSRALIWGGAPQSSKQPTTTNTGWTYDTARNAWSPMTTAFAPSPRYGHSAIWTGTEMIVWGGNTATNGSLSLLNDGGRFTP